MVNNERLVFFCVQSSTIRKVAELTQLEMSTMLGVTRQTVLAIEGGTVPSRPLLLALLFMYRFLGDSDVLVSAANNVVGVNELIRDLLDIEGVV